MTCTKRLEDLPAAHRQHTHPGHCAFVHGHNFAFELKFSAKFPDVSGFILDFGGSTMRKIKEYIKYMFDHTLLINKDDPLLPFFKERPDLFKVREVLDGSCEGLTGHLQSAISDILMRYEGDRVTVIGVTVFEDGKNSATFSV